MEGSALGRSETDAWLCSPDLASFRYAGTGPCKHRTVKRTEPSLFAKDSGIYPSSRHQAVVFDRRPGMRFSDRRSSV